jgi:hypothetical protein
MISIRICDTIALPVVLYGCETWYLSLREEHGLMVFENRVLRRIFGPMRYEVARNLRKLHNEELLNLYLPLIIIIVVKSRRIKSEGYGE